ncbi:MAG: hypothetical protein COV67_05395 [Nitrospinae bacterium CG11_big_fil_rev_8_21_14_0_20_56_8]|nr:MAG: hypothetical protein COV67_05395 [Nitrospinae bacterium CG11_big_fil_rev_8_21_14_0_20_56_8]
MEHQKSGETGEILENKPKKRFVDNGDGTVTDYENNLMWKQTDAFQDTSKWTNWFTSQDYIRQLNLKKFAGYNTWRMPTIEEAESLFDENMSIRDMDRFEIYISPCFSPAGGFTTWTIEEREHGTAVVFYYRYGHANLANKELDVTKDTVRAVRSIS